MVIRCLGSALAVALWAAPVAAQTGGDTSGDSTESPGANGSDAGSETPDAADDEPAEGTDEPEDDATRRARAALKRGHDLAREEQWAAALAAFEEAAATRDAPLVQYNIAYCQRALGRYVAARQTILKVLSEPGSLSQSYQEDLRAYADELDEVVVRLDLSVLPAGAELTIDGRPLIRDRQGDYLAGVADRDDSAPIPAGNFTVLLDPGSHMLRARRQGFGDAFLQKSFRPGAKPKLTLRLDELPATIVVKSQPEQAIVRIDEREVGIAPITFERPAGSYRLEVVREDYETYSAELDLHAGQRAELTAELLPYEAPLYERWWFWTAIGGALTAAVVITVVATQPEPEPPPYETGNTDWLVDPQSPAFVLSTPALRF